MARFSDLIIEPRFLRAVLAGQYLGCPGLLARMEKAGWIKAIVQRHKMKIYKRGDLDACAERVERGEFPECE